MATIRHSLQTEIFRPIDERLMTFVHVYKPHKKRKTSNFLCLTVTKEAPIVFYIHQVKKTEKNVLKKKRCWSLSALKIVDGISDSSSDEKDFDLHFDKVYKWTAVSLEERQTFLVILWKQCMNSMTGSKPEFKNLPKEWLMSSSTSLPASIKPESDGTSGGDNVVLIEPEEYQALSEKEEADLEKMMHELHFSVNNAEEFVGKLTKQLSYLDEKNLHSVLSSEEKVSELINRLDSAINEVEKLESQFDSYDEILGHVRTTIEKMEQKNVLIQIVNRNNEKLLYQLERVVHQLELAPKHQAALIDADLTTPHGLKDAIAAAKELQAVMNAEIHPALVQLTAVQEQKKRFDKWKSKFSHNLSRYLNNLFIHIGNDTSKLKLNSVELILPVRSQFHSDLGAYTPLMHWCKVMDRKAYVALIKIYTFSLGKLYERDIKQFMEEAKHRVAGDRMNSVSEDSRRTSIGSRTSGPSGLLGIEKEQWTHDFDEEERTRFDQVLEIVLSQLEPVCLSEQNFCVSFFQLDVLSPTSKNTQTTLEGYTDETRKNDLEKQQISQKKIDKKVNEEVRRMMSEIFGCIESELLSFVTHHEKLDNVYCMSALIHLTEHVMSAQDTGSFLSITFGSVLVHVKRNYDKYMQTQEKSIRESRLPRKSKCGIIPFVSNFEDFAKTAENIFRNTERRTDLDKWYVKLMTTIFETIQNIAGDHPKTPPEVIKMENFHHLYALLSQLKISVLDIHRKEAKQKYNDALNAYVTRYFGRPLEKLNLFFEGVQVKVAQGVKESEISYQVAFSKQELRQVIREYPAREVKKGLDHLYKKVDKHLCEEENLLQVVWRAMQEEFIQQYKSIEDLIQRCYPGSMICLEFSIEDILQFFSEIARSH
ncbi:hypothetical protein V9T40_007377 [Parthenolecanium corni]|uniref:Exocyst complex component Sec3 PIP2-binding N-terminal domain-containing protein n=1 Tax=Parthenolecanium corni TaxID=536013 RepID=A0AAN9U3I6_9HEMI